VANVIRNIFGYFCNIYNVSEKIITSLTACIVYILKLGIMYK
jgi:hypothetical protein